MPLFPELREDLIAEVGKEVDEAKVIFLLGKVVSEFSKTRQNIIKDLFFFLHKCVVMVVLYYACFLGCALDVHVVVILF